MGNWQFARELFDKQFQPLRAAGYTLERLHERKAYWELHTAELAAHFPQEVFFALPRLRSEHEVTGQVRLGEARGDDALSDFTVVRKDGQIAAMFCGVQLSPSTYRMWHTHVHPSHRRRGIYTRIVQGTIAYTAALGFDTITSEHAPSNNPILIAKLRAGFRVAALDIDAGVGPCLVLRYFHNPEHLAAYELRCGLATLTPALATAGHGAWALLREQVLAAGAPPPKA